MQAKTNVTFSEFTKRGEEKNAKRFTLKTRPHTRNQLYGVLKHMPDVFIHCPYSNPHSHQMGRV
jgi:hypothetical protein